MRRLWFRVLASIGFISLLGVGSKANAQLVNGDFEAGSYVFDGLGIDSLAVGSTAITGWTTVGAEIAVITQPNRVAVTAESGNISLDLTGYHDSSPYGGISQTVNTVAGRNYSLSFFLGSQFGNVSIDVTTGLTTKRYTNSSGGPGPVWQQYTDDFTATGETVIQFLGISATTGFYIPLDNISLTGDFDAPVNTPEPGSFALISGVAVAVVQISRRRHSK